MARALGAFVLVAMLVALAAAPGRASLYQPEDPMAVPVRPDGVGEAFPFDEFKRRFAAIGNQINSEFKSADGQPTDRDKLLLRAKARQQTGSLSPDETAALAVDLLRLGKTDEAVNRLKPLNDDRDRKGTRTYAVCAALIHTHAARGEWDQALNYELDLQDAPRPAAVKGLSPAQWQWQLKLDRDYLPHYLAIRKAEAKAEAEGTFHPETVLPTPLFPLPRGNKPAEAVRFVNDAGKYEPGVLAKTERVKLPPDAIAVVQQFLLWFPSDTRLFWLLAELYAADGQLSPALAILNECMNGRKYSKHRICMEHRAALQSAVDAKPQSRSAEDAIAPSAVSPAPSDSPKPTADASEVPIDMRAVWLYFGAVVAIAVVAVLRGRSKRSRGSAWPGCCG